MNTQYLKIGDLVHLYTDQGGGYMASIGYQHPQVYVQRCEKEDLKMMPNIRNMVFKVVPKLVYDATREYQKEKNQFSALQNQKSMRSNKMAVSQSEEENQEKIMMARNLQILRVRMIQEQQYNEKLILSKQGEIVLYGQDIQLQHLDSGEFLQISKQGAEVDRECQKLTLTINPSPSRVVFEIYPRYKYRQEGDKIVYGDHVLFYNEFTMSYIHFSNEQELPLEDHTDMPSTYRAQCPYRRVQIEAYFPRYEVNIKNLYKKWQIFPYRQGQTLKDSSKFVYGGSVIRFKHAESGGYICVDEEIKSKHGEPQAYIRIFTGEDQMEAVSTNSLFEVEVDSEEELGQLAMWKNEESEEVFKYRFRHLNSGRVLKLSKIIKNEKEIFVLTLDNYYHEKFKKKLTKAFENGEQEKEGDSLKEQIANNSLFILESSTIDSDNFINGDCVVKIKSASEGGLYITSVKKKIENEVDMNESQDSALDDLENLEYDQDFLERNSLEDDIKDVMGEGKMDSKIYTPMNQDEFNFTKVQHLMMRKAYKEDDIFIMRKVDNSDISDVLFIHSCIPLLKQFIYFIRKSMHDKLTIPYFSQVEDLISNLIFFVTETESKDPFTCEGIPYQKRQKFMRELRVIDLLVDILHYPFAENCFNINEITQRHPITRICQLVFRLLKHCAKEYTLNKFYIAQFIELYFNQAMTATENNSFKAEGTITELLKNNNVLLDKQITADTIQNFFDLCKSQVKNERFLNLLSTLCSCNGEAVASNQDDICDILLSNEENKEALVLKVQSRSPVHHEIILKEPEIDNKTLWIKIEDLYDTSMKRDDLRIYNYFKALINLSAEICLQRNYKGIILLEKIFTLDQVYHCATSGGIPLKLRQKFAKLLLHLHIDKDPLEHIAVPVLTRVWHEIASSRSELPQSKVPVPSQLLSLKPFTSRFFQHINGVLKAYEIDFNNYTIEILDLVETMLKLGFYNDEQELIQMIDPLITMLDGSLDIITQEQEQLQNKRSPQNVVGGFQGLPGQLMAIKGADNDPTARAKRYKTNESNLVLMMVKNKIINILLRVLDIQNDIRLTQFLMEFHKDEQNQPTAEETEYINRVLKGKGLEERLKKDEKLAAIKATSDDKVIKWMNIAFEDKKLDLERISERDFVCILLDLILYENSQLVNNAFKILMRFFQQKQAIIELASEVQLLEDDREIAILRSVSSHLTEMKKDAENAEFWFGYTNKDCLKKARHQMEKFDMLTDLCIKKNNQSKYDFTDHQRLNMSISKVEAQKLSSRRKQGAEGNGEELNESDLMDNVSDMLQDWDDDDIKVVADTEQSDPQNQRLLRNLRAHQVALILVKQKDLANSESQNAYLRVLERVYIFLIKFVRNNKENQLLLMDQIDQFLEDIEFGVHALELIAETLKDNEKLSQINIQPIIKRICQLSDEQSIESPKKATMISFLSYFITCNGLPLRENQCLILNELTNSNRKNTIYLFIGEEGLETFELYMEEMRKHYGQFMLDEKLMPEIFVPSELTYTIEFLKLMAECCQGRNNMTEVKCQSLFTIKDIQQNLKIASFCYPLKKALVDVLLHIYLDTEKEVSDDNTTLLWSIMEVLHEDLTKYVEIIKKLQKSKKTIDDERRGVSLKKSLLQNEMEKITTVDVSKNFKLRNCFGSYSIAELLEKYVFETLIPVSSAFFELRLKIDDSKVNLVKSLLNNFSKVSQMIVERDQIKIVNNLFKTLSKIPQIKEYSDSFKNAQQDVQTGEKKKDGGGTGNKKGYKQEGQITKAMKLKAMMISANTSEDLRVQFEKEFEENIQSIIFIKKKSEIGFEGKNTLETKDILQSLINITDVNSDIEKDLRRTSLKILRKVIEMENKDMTVPSAEWDTEEWIKYEYQIKERQNMLINIGIVKLICRIISFETVIAIKEEAILAAIAVLLGGNYESQQKFYKYILKDTENVFGQKLKDMIMECFEVIKKHEMRRNQQMLKYYQIQKKIEELRDLLDEEGNEIKKMQQQLVMIEEEIKEQELNSESNDATLTPKRALSFLQISLRFLQLLCENHNINLQNMLREQVNIEGNSNGKSVDFVSLLAKLFGQYQKIFSSKTCDVGNQIVDCLIEFIQGPCHNNQKALITAKIIDSSRDFIAGFDKEIEYQPLGFTSDFEDQERISELKKKIVTLLLSLLEGETDMDILNRMSHSLDFEVAKERMLIVFTNFTKKMLKDDNVNISTLSLSSLNNKLEKDSFEGNINEAFELYMLMQLLAENIEMARKNLDYKKFSPEQWKAYNFIRSHTAKIEIAVRNNLQSVYFPIRPLCHCISTETRKKLMININRESQASKVDGLMQKVPDLMDEMINNEALSRSKIQITPQKLSALKDFSTFLAVLVNLILLAFMERINHYKDAYEAEEVVQMIYYLGLIQGASSGLLIICYIITRGGLITKAKWREYTKKNRRVLKPFNNEERYTVHEMSIEMTHNILMTKGPEAPEFNLTDKIVFGNAFTRFEYYMFNFWFFIQDGKFLYYLLYFMISMLGLFYLDVFYAFHLLDFIARSPVLQNVIKSVTQNGKQLVMIAILQLAIIFCYSTIGFFYLQDTFIDPNINKFEADTPEENFCMTMLQCFTQLVNLGLRNGGGIGDSTLPIGYYDKEKYFIKFAYDCSYHILVIIVMINILFGVIIDTFAQLRDHKKSIDEDMKNVCFICNIDRYTFEKYSDGLEKHIERDHNLWLYVYFIVHLQMKDPTEFTGIESYVQEKYEQGDISWVPLMKALCLKNSNYSEEEGGDGGQAEGGDE